MSVVFATIATAFAIPFFQTKNQRSLPFEMWLPYDYKPENLFWITYIFVFLGLFYNITISIGSDFLLYGILINLCGQLDVLSKRFFDMTQIIKNQLSYCKSSNKHRIIFIEKKLLVQCIQHQLFIYK